MHGFLAALLIAAANSLDNLGAWIAFDMNGIRASARVNLWLSAVTMVVSAGAAWLGRSLSGVLDQRVCGVISAAVFIGMGAWFLLEPFRKRREDKKSLLIGILEHPEQADINHSKDIDFKEAALLGVALSLNNAGGSFSGGLVGISPWAIGVLSVAFSFGALWLGRWISGLLRRWGLNKKAVLVSGAILILIGLKQIF